MSYRQFGPTRIVAGLRCLLAVVSEADEVDVPDWLAKKLILTGEIACHSTERVACIMHCTGDTFMSQDIEKALSHFKRCVEDAPDGTHEDAKRLDEMIGSTCDRLMRDIRSLGLKADACDLIFTVEATIYDYVKRSNPDSTLFPVAEGFGAAMAGPARERVIAQATSNLDFLRSIGAVAR